MTGAAPEMDETKTGRLDHKIEKLKIVKQVLGTEAMRSDVRADSTGLCLIERAPWGVIGMACRRRIRFRRWRATRSM